MDSTLYNADHAENGPTLVIRANSFTHTIDDGYLMTGKRRVSDLMTTAEIAAYLAAHPKTRVDFLRT